MLATATAFSPLSANPALAAEARSTKSRTASYWESRSTAGRKARSGSPSGGTATPCSPESLRTARLVASIVSPGQAASRSARRGAAAATCSTLSTNSSWRFPTNVLRTCSKSGDRPSSRSPAACAMAVSTRSGVRIGARGTKQSPSAKSPPARNAVATWSARRDFPTPPGPVSVTRRMSARRRSAETAAISRSLPINWLSGTGRSPARTRFRLDGGAGPPGRSTIAPFSDSRTATSRPLH